METGRIFLAALLCLPLAAWAADTRLVYPLHQGVDPEKPGYYIKLLKLALERSGKSYVLEPSPSIPSRPRAFTDLDLRKIDVLWAVTTREREQRWRPVRFPLERGLVGWRICQLSATAMPALERVADLRTLSYGAGSFWPDTEILRRAGLKVEAAKPDKLGAMLRGGRFDCLPRGALEMQGVMAADSQGRYRMEPRFVIHYPSAFYFFVHRDARLLAADLEHGLERALADGSFLRLFEAEHAAKLRLVRLAEREILELDNPLMPPETPLARAELWYWPETRTVGLP